MSTQILRVNPEYNSILFSLILNLRLLNHLDHRHHHLQPINRNKDFLQNLDTKQNFLNPKSKYAICFAPGLSYQTFMLISKYQNTCSLSYLYIIEYINLILCKTNVLSPLRSIHMCIWNEMDLVPLACQDE